jgi:hypothetical protein
MLKALRAESLGFDRATVKRFFPLNAVDPPSRRR